MAPVNACVHGIIFESSKAHYPANAYHGITWTAGALKWNENDQMSRLLFKGLTLLGILVYRCRLDTIWQF